MLKPDKTASSSGRPEFGEILKNAHNPLIKTEAAASGGVPACRC
jgi:hypothetical protein